MTQETKLQSQAESLAKEIAKLRSESKDVARFLELQEAFQKLEEELKKVVTDNNVTISYYDPIENKDYKISRCTRITYPITVEDVRENFGEEFIEEAVNIKAMKKAPECAVFLDKNSKESYYARKIVDKTVDI